MTFDRRWRRLAAHARSESTRELELRPLPRDLAARARRREPESLPLVSPRCAWMFAVAAAFLTAFCAPFVAPERTLRPSRTLAQLTTLPPPPHLPPPPALESPAHYVALARATWKDLTP